eukprot:TRINITY_DN22780_c0_g1_i1.p1 TRINITY_DN22780_c0_g1~~TRINITY_DN22780_c0_g1_i1.p1  ORF type:complete len:1085 (-),score=111.19 TRINITY_DN22780_c0_g1_i1:65-3229(-)
MAAKSVTITDVSITTSHRADGSRGTPDCYLIFSSLRAQAGSRSDFRANDWNPSFPGPYTLGLGGPRDGEVIEVQLWDYDRGTGRQDDRMESARLSLEQEPAVGRKTWALSRGGEVTLSWSIRGREAPAPTPSPEPAPLPGQPDDLVSGRKVTVTGVRAQRLLPRDGRNGAVDPYVLVSGKSRDVQVRWSTQWNVPNPSWSDVQELDFDPAGYEVEVWDQDTRGGDDLLGQVDIFFEEGTASVQGNLVLPWRGQRRDGGNIEFQYQLSPAASPDPPPAPVPVPEDPVTPPDEPVPPPQPPAPTIVVRKEIRKMPRHEQEHFALAVRKMMENTAGPGTSEYFRLAGYHGWPSDFCHHNQETFPGWHRGYLCDFEQALINADKALGNDGNIGLPYWDWSEPEVNGEVVPGILREYFPDLPDGLVDVSEAGSLGRRGYRSLHSDTRVRQNVEHSRAAFAAEQSLTLAEHWMHASTRFNRNTYPVEAPHNSIHMACGFPMTSLRYAAFHPVFFLHHCNVDRVYEKHVQMETPSECAQEFASRQRSLARSRRETNRYLAPLRPFTHPRTREDLMPSMTFNTRDLLFQYDELPNDPVMMMREEPVFAAFVKVDVLQLNYKSYLLHVFLMPKGEGASWSIPDGGPETWPESQYYAGNGSIFGGKGLDCTNCIEKGPITVFVEVQETLLKLGLSRYTADIRVICEDEEGVISKLEETPVPAPVLVGPMFDSMDTSLVSLGSEWDAAATDGNVEQLQKVLHRLGWEPGLIDGKFGPKTEDALKRFQMFVGLQVDGVAGPLTKAQLNEMRHDQLPDGGVASAAKARFAPGSVIGVSVGILPGYLEHRKEEALNEIMSCFELWGEAMSVHFTYSPTPLHAEFHIDFEDLSRVGEAHDLVARAGGQLAEATSQGVILDAAERWLLKSQSDLLTKYPKAVRLFTVLLHEVGHCLGLSHSSNPADVMWPYYRKDTSLGQELSANDKARALELVSSSGTSPDPRSEITAGREAAAAGASVATGSCGCPSAAPIAAVPAENCTDQLPADACNGTQDDHVVDVKKCTVCALL